MRKLTFTLLASTLTVVGAAAAIAQEGDSSVGQKLFQQRCGTCHQIATPRNGVGPTLQGVVGRVAGSVEAFNYSQSLRNAGITWSPETLETFLTNPGSMFPGTRMTQRFNKADERSAIIDFLATR